MESNKKLTFLEKIFSVKNVKQGIMVYKVFTILGIKFKFKHYKKQQEIFIKTALKSLEQIKNKSCMKNDIWQFDNIKFYVPYYPIDLIQRCIVDNNEFFEETILSEVLDNYIPDNAIIFDIGANIGNHSLYWSLRSPKNVSKIYAFEPIKDTFDILAKNIEINNVSDIVKIHNFGLSDQDSAGEIIKYTKNNIGGTCLKPVADVGNGIQLRTLDNLDINVDKIDLMKIDVENMEIFCLRGAKNTIRKYKPSIFIESAPDYIENVKEFMQAINYRLKEILPEHNYIFVPNEPSK